MEEQLNKVLDSIEQYYFSEIDSHARSLIISEKWREYLLLSDKYKINIPRAYDLFLLGENNSFIVDAINEIYDISNQDIIPIVDNLKEVLLRRNNGEDVGIPYEHAILLLKWSVSNTRRQIASLGVDVSNSSLNGFCDLAQISSLIPFENIGLSVTKNSIEGVFDSVNHHVFGTVTFPISVDNCVQNFTFLIDPTYRQFFTATRCNEGRYFIALEDDNPIAPDPGYFMDNDVKIGFSNELISNGFILFNEENAKIYGDAFSYSNISISNYSLQSPIVEKRDGNYYIDRVNMYSSNYSLSLNDLVEYAFITHFPEVENTNIKNSR